MTSATLRAPLAVVLGFVFVTCIEVAITLTRFAPDITPEVRAMVVAHLIGYRAALAIVLALLFMTLLRVAAAMSPHLGRLVAALLFGAVSLAIGTQVFADDLYSYPRGQRIALSIGLSLVPAGVVALRGLVGLVEAWRATRVVRSRGRGRVEAALLRLPFVALGVGAAVANQLALRYGNRGPHLGLLVVAAVATAMALVGGELPAVTRFARSLAGRALAAVMVVVALWSVSTPPASRVAHELARDESPGLYAFLAPVWPVSGPEPVIDPTWLARFVGAPRWFTRRDHLPATPPSAALVDPATVLVVLVTVDALRQDVLTDPQHAALMPNLRALFARSTVFTQAHASSSTTAPSIASIYTGRYYSQLYWTPEPFEEGRRVRYFPSEDDTPRLPELLPTTVRSFTVPSNERLRQSYGAIRGMHEEADTDTRKDLMAAEVVPILGDWVVRNGSGPLLAHVHLMDAHSPYARGPGTRFERYLRSLDTADAALGRLVTQLESAGLWQRTVLIVAADHGEAFGEHGHHEHGGAIHAELTRVPIVIHVPGQPAREVDQPVSLIDLGPTILDLFAQPTPGGFQGQSLLPLVAGGDVQLERPVAIESSRLHRALVFRDGFKCIWRVREQQYELYDLRRDPDERDNIVDDEPTATLRTAAVRQFFAAHALVRPGYTTPYLWP